MASLICHHGIRFCLSFSDPQSGRHSKCVEWVSPSQGAFDVSSSTPLRTFLIKQQSWSSDGNIPIVYHSTLSMRANYILLSKSSSGTDGIGEFPGSWMDAPVDLLRGCSPTSCTYYWNLGRRQYIPRYTRLSELRILLGKRKNADISVGSVE